MEINAHVGFWLLAMKFRREWTRLEAGHYMSVVFSSTREAERV
jgi:hypothetical protein